MATNSKLSESLKGNRNAAKDYSGSFEMALDKTINEAFKANQNAARKYYGAYGAVAGGLEEKAKFSAAGAKVGFAFGGMLEKAGGSTATTTVTSKLGSTTSVSENPYFKKGTAAKMAITGAKIGAKLADISPIGEIKGRQKAFNTFDRMWKELK